MRISTTIIFVICFLHSTVFSQIQDYKITNLSTDDGLPTDNIIYTYQDSYGFLWMASYEGLMRWDGYNYKRYFHSQKDSTSISGNIVYTILEDHKKRLWIGTIDGLNLYDREKDNFVRCDIGKETMKIPVNDIREDSKNQLWLGTSYGLCKYTFETKSAQWFVHDPGNTNTLSHDVIFRLAIDASDNLWMGTFEGGVTKFSPSEGVFTRFQHKPNDPGTICSNKIKSLIVDHDDQVWIGSYDKGVTLLSTEGKVLRHFRRAGGNTNDHEIQSDVSCIYEDKNQTIWLGIKGQVLRYKEKNSNEFVTFANSPYKNPGLSCISIASISEDSFGNLWFASQSHGLFQTNVHKNVFRHFYKGKNPRNGLNNNVVTTVHEDRKGRIWIGTDGGGLTLYEPAKNKFTNYTTHDGLSSNSILEIREDKKGDLWLATWSGGIMRFNPVTGKVISYVNDPGNANSLILNNVKSILPQDSLVWIGTHGEGLSVYDIKNDKFISHATNKRVPFNLKAPAWINHLFLDSKERLWISTYGGLFLFDKENLTHFSPTKSNASISSDVVNMVAEDHEGNIWVISESGGLDRFKENELAFERYSDQYNLPKTIKAITFDSDGKMWLGSNEGIVTFDIHSKRIDRYDQTDGLQGNSFFHKAALTAGDGTLYFGGPNGMNIFHPDSLKSKEKDFNISVFNTDLHIYDQLQTRESPASPLKKVLALTDTLILQPGQSFFSIGYAALNLYAPSRTQYAYQLEGLHDNWINTGFETKASFTNLDPGDYVFKVRYTDEGNRWHEASRRLHIIVLPPWWKTWWFKLLSLAAALSIVTAFVYLRLSRIKEQNRLLEAEVSRRTHELSEANHFLVEKNEEIKLQNEKLEEFNREILRQSEKILLQQKENLDQNQQLEQTVQELHKSNRTKDRFFSILAHDLRNPISALSGVAESLKLNLPELAKKDISQYVESIYRSSQSVYTLLTNLLSWSRTQSHQIRYSPADFDITAVIKKNIALLASQAQQKNIHIRLDAGITRKVFADYNMVDTVVRNLLSNSIKFTNAKGEISVCCAESDHEVSIGIRDNGVGIAQDQLENLFKIEKKFLSTGTAGETGTGLGLVITHEFIQANKGTISVTSQQGEGSTFLFTLPKSTCTIDAASEEIPVKPETGLVKRAIIDFPEEKLLRIKGRRILIIDDDRELRYHLRLSLSATFEIFEAENGNDGLKKALEVQPTVIITDMKMPVMDGEAFCRQIKEIPATSHIPVILLTNQSHDDGPLLGYGAGADVYLTKPARKELLLQIIYNFVRAQEKIHEQILNSHNYFPEDVAINKVDEDFLNQVIGIIEANVSDPELDHKLLCDETALSRTVLYAKIKALTGQGVNEFIKSIRLKKSLQLLREGKLNISQIALEVGFNSHSYFNKCFIKQYNTTPKEYGKHLRKAAVDE